MRLEVEELRNEIKSLQDQVMEDFFYLGYCMLCQDESGIHVSRNT